MKPNSTIFFSFWAFSTSGSTRTSRPCLFRVGWFLFVWVTTRVYKKRSTAEKYMLNLTIINSLCVICILLFVFLLFLLTNNNYVTYMLYFILNICFLYSIGDIAWFACYASCTCVCVCLFVLVSHSIAGQLWTIVLAPVENGGFSSMGLGWDTNRGLFGNEVMFKYCCDKSEKLKHLYSAAFSAFE